MDHMKARARAAVLGFGRRVREHRLAAGLSQVDLGRRSHVTDKFIGQIERGESNPSLVTMMLVAGALECNLVDLLPIEKASDAYVAFRAEDVRRAQDALAVLGSIVTRHKPASRQR